MLLKLTHTTDLNYSDLISESVMELRMAPRQEEDHHRLSFTLAIGPPAPAMEVGLRSARGDRFENVS